jgi:hypothetical protein
MSPRPRILRLTAEGIRDEMIRLGVHPRGLQIMEKKASQLLIRIEDLDLCCLLAETSL